MAPVIDILMYHSVSDAGGPTSIPPATFAMQMRALAESGVPVVSLDDLAASRSGGPALPARSVIVTFDDGFRDFADAAWPVMVRHGIRPMVYLPTGFVGRAEGWKGIREPARPLMDWTTVRRLADEGVAFGSHTVRHPDLDSLAPGALAEELDRSKREIEDRLGQPAEHFAPPYGIAGPRVRAEIARRYRTSVGTQLRPAQAEDALHDLPRIEMFYFRNEGLWRRHLSGRGAPYLAGRRLLRGLRSALRRPWQGV